MMRIVDLIVGFELRQHRACDALGLAGREHADEHTGDIVGSVGWLEAVAILALFKLVVLLQGGGEGRSVLLRLGHRLRPVQWRRGKSRTVPEDGLGRGPIESKRCLSMSRALPRCRSRAR